MILTRSQIRSQGSKKSKIKEECVLFNAANSEREKISRNDAERLFRNLLLKNVLQEQLVVGQHENVIAYLKLGTKAVELDKGRMKVRMCLFLRYEMNVVEWDLII